MLSLQNKEMTQRNKYEKNMIQNSLKLEISPNSHSELKQVYMCSCGKQYQSFPATYLHFRTKHDIKLSTKSSEKRKITSIQGDTKKITYLVELNLEINAEPHSVNSAFGDKGTNNQDLGICQSVKIIQSCISKYSNFTKPFYRILYQKLSQFFNQMMFKDNFKELSLSIDQIPYFLNQFILTYLPKYENSLKVGSKQWKQTCEQLYRFSNWLRQQKYTDLIVIYQKQ